MLDLTDSAPRHLARASAGRASRPVPLAGALLALQMADPEERLLAAQPRLLAFMRGLGVPEEATDDLVQETLLAGWRQRGTLREPERFDSWLTAIARNHYRMYLRALGTARRHTDARLFPTVTVAEPPQPEGADAVPDPTAVDPLDELSRQDLTTLVDRALGHLSAPARHVVELRYLAELPESEVANSLGLSVTVLEARLHRARRQLRQVLEGPLRAEAETLGLAMATAAPAGWQETRLWCNLCGQRRLLGTFAENADGRRDLRLRCPVCSPRYDADIYASKAIVSLDGLRSFRPALTRTMRALANHATRALRSGWETCPHCHKAVRWRIAGPQELSAKPACLLGQHWLIAEHAAESCPGLCGYTAVEPAVWFHPAAQRFVAAHPRWITLPEKVVEYQGRPAIHFELGDAVGAARLVLLADAQTLRILAAPA